MLMQQQSFNMKAQQRRDSQKGSIVRQASESKESGMQLSMEEESNRGPSKFKGLTKGDSMIVRDILGKLKAPKKRSNLFD